MRAITALLPQLPLLTSLMLEGAAPDEDEEEVVAWEKSTWNMPPVLRSLTIVAALPLPIMASTHLRRFDGDIRPSAAAALLRNCPSLTDVSFCFGELVDDNPHRHLEEKLMLDALSGGRNLQNFFAEGSLPFSLPWVTALASTAKSALRKVDLVLGNETASVDALIAFGQHCPNLQDVCLRHSHTEGEAHLDPHLKWCLELLSVFPVLHTVHLSLVSDTALKCIFCPAVTHLHISGFRGDPAEIFQSFPALQILNYNTYTLYQHPVAPTAAPMLIPTLTRLVVAPHIHSLSISPDPLGLAVMARCPNVSCLDVQTPAHASFLFALSTVPTVAALTAFSCHLSLLSDPSFTEAIIPAAHVFLAAVVDVIRAMPRLKHASLGVEAPNYHFMLKGLAPFIARGLKVRKLLPLIDD